MSDRPVRPRTLSDKFSVNEEDLEITWGPNVFQPEMTEGEEQANLLDILASVNTREELATATELVVAFYSHYSTNDVVSHALLDATKRVEEL